MLTQWIQNGDELASLLRSLDPVKFEYLRLSFEKYREHLRVTHAIPPYKFLEARNKIVREIASACPKESGWTESRIDNVTHLGLLLDVFGRK